MLPRCGQPIHMAGPSNSGNRPLCALPFRLETGGLDVVDLATQWINPTARNAIHHNLIGDLPKHCM